MGSDQSWHICQINIGTSNALYLWSGSFQARFRVKWGSKQASQSLSPPKSKTFHFIIILEIFTICPASWKEGNFFVLLCHISSIAKGRLAKKIVYCLFIWYISEQFGRNLKSFLARLWYKNSTNSNWIERKNRFWRFTRQNSGTYFLSFALLLVHSKSDVVSQI